VYKSYNKLRKHNHKQGKDMYKQFKKQDGFLHLQLVIAAAAVIVGVALVGSYVVFKSKAETLDSAPIESAVVEQVPAGALTDAQEALGAGPGPAHAEANCAFDQIHSLVRVKNDGKNVVRESHTTKAAVSGVTVYWGDGKKSPILPPHHTGNMYDSDWWVYHNYPNKTTKKTYKVTWVGKCPYTNKKTVTIFQYIDIPANW
jgi:hypothetical protein